MWDIFWLRQHHTGLRVFFHTCLPCPPLYVFLLPMAAVIPVRFWWRLAAVSGGRSSCSHSVVYILLSVRGPTPNLQTWFLGSWINFYELSFWGKKTSFLTLLFFHFNLFCHFWMSCYFEFFFSDSGQSPSSASAFSEFCISGSSLASSSFSILSNFFSSDSKRQNNLRVSSGNFFFWWQKISRLFVFTQLSVFHWKKSLLKTETWLGAEAFPCLIRPFWWIFQRNNAADGKKETPCDLTFSLSLSGVLPPALSGSLPVSSPGLPVPGLGGAASLWDPLPPESSWRQIFALISFSSSSVSVRYHLLDPDTCSQNRTYNSTPAQFETIWPRYLRKNQKHLQSHLSNSKMFLFRSFPCGCELSSFVCLFYLFFALWTQKNSFLISCFCCVTFSRLKFQFFVIWTASPDQISCTGASSLLRKNWHQVIFFWINQTVGRSTLQRKRSVISMWLWTIREFGFGLSVFGLTGTDVCDVYTCQSEPVSNGVWTTSCLSLRRPSLLIRLSSRSALLLPWFRGWWPAGLSSWSSSGTAEYGPEASPLQQDFL